MCTHSIKLVKRICDSVTTLTSNTSIYISIGEICEVGSRVTMLYASPIKDDAKILFMHCFKSLNLSNCTILYGYFY